MKYMFLLALTILMLMAFTACGGSGDIEWQSPVECNGSNPGDLNGDGRVDQQDYYIMRRYVWGR